MDNALLAKVQKQAWYHKHPRGLPLMLFALTFAGTVFGVVAIEQANAEARALELDRNATEIASGLQRRAAENIALLNAAAVLFASDERVSNKSFVDIVSALHADNDSRGSRGVGWARWIDARAVPALQQEVRATGVPDYRVFPQPGQGRTAAAPVVYFQPLDPSSRKAVGFDLYSEKLRREAIDESIRSGRPIASRRLRMLHDGRTAGPSGFLILVPVFADRDRRTGLRGFVYSPFRANEFLASAQVLFGRQPGDIVIHEGARQPGRLLAERRLPGENGASLSRRITVADREWILTVTDKKPDSLSLPSRITLLFGGMMAVLLMMLARLITKRAAEDRLVVQWLTRQSAIRNSLTRELNHRVKNTLANVLSIVSLTRRRSADIGDFADSLTGRIRALSATHDLLSQSDWNNAPIDEIVRSELAPYVTEADSPIEMSGPEISLAPNDALSLGLAIHELVTNAAKYGALSTAEGRIHIAWRLIEQNVAELRWREEGGPPVDTPIKRGFGRDLIEKIVAHELQTTVDLRFEASGVECTLRVPVRRPADFSLRSAARED